MRRILVVGMILAMLSPVACSSRTSPNESGVMENHISLPGVQARTAEGRTLADLFERRRSERDFAEDPLLLADVVMLLRTLDPVPVDTTGSATRSVPSAGATHPLSLFVLVGEVEELSAGIYHYEPGSDHLTGVRAGDWREDLAALALQQSFLSDAPVIFILAADDVRTDRRYGARARQYVDMEVGHAGQNLLLMAEALQLASVPVGAFDDEPLQRLLNTSLRPVYILPVGVPVR